ncbi:MAG: hypothetical protein CVU57_19145 [Deltaproteobacteria bacterium HGW-Deltaproteobacteria-15]|nr:MAG: hypothetical protein CVU57_19145 [Deltaproteobacteria bacterium HGW-Deltaproteobacteria-15]
MAFTFISDELNGITHDNYDPETCNAVPDHCKDMACWDCGKVRQLIQRRVSGQDNSDQCKEMTLDRDCGKVRPLILRRFSSFSEAEEENGQSRIYLGVHWSFDKTEGIDYGRKMADYVYKNVFQPVNGNQHRGNPVSPMPRQL